MTPEEKHIAAKLRTLSETFLTKKVIIPLLESLGYQRVEYYGGESEEGKDIICWRLDEFEDPELAVAQVKHYKPSRKASDSRSFETIVNQLINASTKRLPYLDKSLHLPTKVYLITSYKVDTKTLKKRFDAHPALHEQRVKIIDGPKLASLLLRNTPNIVTELMGPQIEIASEIRPNLNNEALLSAIGFRGTKDLKTIYTDIDFSLGKLTTRLFFNASFTPTQKRLNLQKKDWIDLKSTFAQISTEFSLCFLGKEIESIEEDLESRVIRHREWQQQHATLDEKIHQQQKQIASIRKIYSQKDKDLLRRYPSLKKKRRILFDLQKIDRPNKETKDKISKLSKEIRKMQSPLTSIAESITDCKKMMSNLDKRKSRLIAKEPSLLYEVNIDGRILATEIKKQRRCIEKRIAQLNRKSPDVTEVRSFALRCKSIIDAASILLKNPYFAESIGIEGNQILRQDLENTRMHLPIETLFDTGLDIALLGEAGAGKTTSLQVYAQNKLVSESNNKLFIFAPLAHVIQAWLKTQPKLLKASCQDSLDHGIARYLAQLGISITPSEFCLELQTRGGVLLLDGIDEAIKSAPWLLHAIRLLAEKYAKVQVIVSSRISGSYLDAIPFLAVTLLPFTDDQRSEFIKKWFGQEGDTHIKKIELHVRKKRSIGDIVKNPLLTTILCVLEENGVPLPDNEVKLYEERFRLLTGYYDLVKRVRRISSQRQSLEILSRKLGYFLHSKNMRQDARSVLQEISRRLMRKKLNERDATLALNELIDPCNILVPMTEDGKFGFGHLCYQEYKAAQELLLNRGIDLVPLLKQPWWRGVLVLFAQMNENLNWLIDEVVPKMEVGLAQETLIGMISVRPKTERSQLRQIVLDHSKLDDDYTGIPEIWDLDDDWNN